MRYQIWSEDVALARIRMVLVVQEMPRVPNNYVLTVHRVSTDESGDLCLCLRGRYLSPDDGNAIIDLLAVVPENPHVCDAVVIGRAIHRAGPDLVAGSTRFVHDTVSAADSRVALPLCFFDDGVPLQSGWAAACRNDHALHLERVVGCTVDRNRNASTRDVDAACTFAGFACPRIQIVRRSFRRLAFASPTRIGTIRPSFR